MASAKPVKPPTGADFSALVKKVNELAGKVPGVSPLTATVTGRIPLWKRWVGSEGPEYLAAEDGGLYAVTKANAVMLDAVKTGLDATKQDVIDLQKDVQALKEAPAPRPFP